MSKYGQDATRPSNTLGFFITAFAITWLAQAPAALAKHGLIPGNSEAFLPLVGLGAFGPLLAAMIVAYRESRRDGLRQLFRQLASWRAGIGWYLLALLLPGSLLALGMTAYKLCGGGGQVLYLPLTGPTLMAMVIFPLAEEIGWRGLAYPRLQRRHGPLRASLLFSILWAVWHAMMFLASGIDLSTFLVIVGYCVAISLIFTWFYNRPRGGLPIVIVAHMGLHLNNPHQPLPAVVSPLVVHTIGLASVALGLVLCDRKAWQAQG